MFNVLNQWSFIKLRETVWYSGLKDSFRSDLLTQSNIHLFNFVSRHFSVTLQRRMSSVQTLNPSRPRWLWHLMFINVQSISRKLDVSSSVPCPPSFYEQQWCRDKKKKNLLAELFFRSGCISWTISALTPRALTYWLDSFAGHRHTSRCYFGRFSKGDLWRPQSDH